MKHISIAAIAAVVILASAGCKKDTVDPPKPITSMETAVDATVRMKFIFSNGATPFSLNSTELVDSLGNHVKLDSIRFFVSGAHAMDDEGNALAHYEGVYLLVDASATSNDYLLGQIHASHIHEFHFDLGVDAAANSMDLASAPPPLNDPSMYFSAMMGRKFLVAKGWADHGGDGNFNVPVIYECGMDMLLTEAHAHVHHGLTADEIYTAEIDVDLHGLFDGIDLSVNSAPDMDAAASMRMMRNLSDGIDGME